MGLIYKKMNEMQNALIIFEKVCHGYENLFGDIHKSTLISK
jgi:transglutaminase/protease-like cytokinesis protein 3